MRHGPSVADQVVRVVPLPLEFGAALLANMKKKVGLAVLNPKLYNRGAILPCG